MIKDLNETKPKTLKPETPKTTPEIKPKTATKQTLKSEIPKQTLKPETPNTTPGTKPKTIPKQTLKPEKKLEVKFNWKKLEKLRNDFDELRHKFPNKDEISESRKAFYNAKKQKLFESETERKDKNLNKLQKSLKSKTSFEVILIELVMKILIVIIIIMILLMMINTEKLEVLEHY